MDRPAPLLFYGDSYRFPDIYHATGFLAPDPFIAIEDDGDLVLLLNSLELGRGKKESRATSVRNLSEFGAIELAQQGLASEDIVATVIRRVLGERGVAAVRVPPYFPIAVADRLRANDIRLAVASDLDQRRRAKRPDELVALEAVQRATEEAWAEGVDAIRRSAVRPDGTLEFDGAAFTAERLRAIVERALLERGCATPEQTITAPGAQAADPHANGSGPLRAREPIVMDIYPQHARTRYYADMTRTVSKGPPPDEIVRMYEVVKRAQDAGIAALRAGITGQEVHELVEDIIFAAGYDTQRPGHQHRPDDPTPRGFIHGTGHGVGLQIHEAPYIGRGKMAQLPLAPGDVVTVEPGLYEPQVGGVRLEDMLVVTETGARNLTRAPRELVV